MSNFKEKERENKDKIKEYGKSRKVLLCLTIHDFTKKFSKFTPISRTQRF